MCKLLKCSRNISVNAVVSDFLSSIAGLEVCGQPRDGEENVVTDMAWSGGDTDEVVLAVCNSSTQAVVIPQGEVVASGQITEGARKAPRTRKRWSW